MDLKLQVIILLIFRSFIEAEYLLIKAEKKEHSGPALENDVLKVSKVGKSGNDYKLYGWDCDNEKEEKEQSVPALENEAEAESIDSN